MAGFQFRLQTLMKLRLAERDERRAKLADAFEADRILLEQVEEIRRELTETQNATREKIDRGEVDIDHVLHQQRYQLILQGQEKQIEQQRGQIAEEIERRRQVLTEADREVKVLEKLRDRQRNEFEQKEFKQELAHLDEVAQRTGSRL